MTKKKKEQLPRPQKISKMHDEVKRTIMKRRRSGPAYRRICAEAEKAVIVICKKVNEANVVSKKWTRQIQNT